MPALLAASGPQQTLDNLNAIFSSVDEGIVMQTASGEIIECNAAAERVLGLTRDQMMGRTSLDPRWRSVRDDGSDFPGTEHPAMVALATGHAVRNVVMGVHKPDGSLCWITINAVPILEDDKPVRVVTTFADVTARRNAELETGRLRYTNEHSQLMLTAIRDVQALVIAGAEQHLVFDRCLDDLLSLSDSASGFIGQVSRAADGRARLALHAASDPAWTSAAHEAMTDSVSVRSTADGLPALIARTVAGGTRVIANEASAFYAVGAEPSVCAVSTFIGLPLFVGPELIGVVALANRQGGYTEALAERLSPYLSTCSQLTHATRERHHRDEVQRALAVQGERMALVLEASGIGHWDWNPVTDEAVFDERWVGMLGYELGEIEGSGAQWLRLLHPDDLQATLDAVARHIKGEVPQHRAEFRMRHRNGEWIWIFAVGRITERDASGTVTRMVGVHVDISGRKAYEAALAEATAEAQRANRAKSDFLANMSHELRTPMNGVVGAASLLHFTELSEEQRGYSETIRRSAEVLVSLIEDILDFSKIEAERLELENVSLDPCDAIAEVIELGATPAGNKGLELIVDCRTHPALRVEGDVKRVRQVLLNLVSNAIKFTARGHIVVATEHVGNELRVSISDTGIGIPSDKQKLVFDKFMQADSSTTRQFGGTGLGLSISRRLVEAMGGTIGVESSVHKGSTFWFTLPLAPASPDEPAVETELDGARILIVDGCEPSREALSWMLTRHGARTLCVANRDHALEALRRAHQADRSFDLMLVEQTADGLALSYIRDAIANDAVLAHTAVIMTAADLRRADALRAVGGIPSLVMRRPVIRIAEAVSQCADAIATTRACRLHAGRVPLHEPARASDPHTPVRAPALNSAPLRVLLVEDDEVSRFVGRRMLEKQGCIVAIAEDGLRALVMTAERPFDLVFMDCNMPNMDGFEATSLIRTRAANDAATDARVPIVAVTANALLGDRERCLAAGMVDYITKPLLAESVARAIARWRPSTPEPANNGFA